MPIPIPVKFFGSFLEADLQKWRIKNSAAVIRVSKRVYAVFCESFSANKPDAIQAKKSGIAKKERGCGTMTSIRYVRTEDEEFWYHLDKHLSKAEFKNKILHQQK